MRRIRDDVTAMRRRDNRLAIPSLPAVEVIEPSIVSGASMRQLARSIRNFTRGRFGEYDIVRAKQDG
jgi:hypothetical protein